MQDLDLPRIPACGKVKDSAPDYRARRLEMQRFYPQWLKRGEKTFEKKVVMVHPVARGEPKITVWTERGRSFLGCSNKEAGVGFAFMDQKKRTKEFSNAPLHLEIIFFLWKVSLYF